MNDITHIFNKIIHQNKSIDVAEYEFKKMIADDAELRENYKEWCHAVGSTEKQGFLDYCDEFKNSQDDIWDSLSDYDE